MSLLEFSFTLAINISQFVSREGIFFSFMSCFVELQFDARAVVYSKGKTEGRINGVEKHGKHK